MKVITNYVAFDRISSHMAKKYGLMIKGTEADYTMYMMPIESNMMKIRRNTRNSKGRHAIEAIKICLFIIDGYINDMDYDLSKFHSPENQGFVHAILMAVDPFTNEEMKTHVMKEYDLDSKNDLHEFFSTPVKCLLRIERSIEKWTKNNGQDGYFNFLESHMGHAVPDDLQMHFTYELRHDNNPIILSE